jgi:outer membrane protein OmpA-like peptidoglycan-associated protein
MVKPHPPEAALMSDIHWPSSSAYTCTYDTASPEPEPVEHGYQRPGSWDDNICHVEGPLDLEVGTPVIVGPLQEMAEKLVPHDLRFAPDSAELGARETFKLSAFRTSLHAMQRMHGPSPMPFAVHVAGHTDNTGSEAYNLALSEARAERAAYFLADAPGGHGASYVWYGERRPIGDNATPEGRAANRRVDVSLVPVSQPSGDQLR